MVKEPGYENVPDEEYREIVEVTRNLKKKLKQNSKNELISIIVHMVNMHAQQKQVNKILLAKLKEEGKDEDIDLDSATL